MAAAGGLLQGDGRAHALDQVRIPGGGHGERDGKTGPAFGLVADAVRAVAAGELRDAQARVAIGLVEELLDFLLRRSSA